MRVLVPLALGAMTLAFSGWTLSSENHMPWKPNGKAVVKTPTGASHVIRSSICNFGPHAGRLRFGGVNWPGVPYMSIVVREQKGNPTLLDIIDGVLVLRLPKSSMTVRGTAHVQERPVRRGTFVLFTHKGRYTGSWVCGK